MARNRKLSLLSLPRRFPGNALVPYQQTEENWIVHHLAMCLKCSHRRILPTKTPSCCVNKALCQQRWLKRQRWCMYEGVDMKAAQCEINCELGDKLK